MNIPFFMHTIPPWVKPPQPLELVNSCSICSMSCQAPSSRRTLSKNNLKIIDKTFGRFIKTFYLYIRIKNKRYDNPSYKSGWGPCRSL
jgi:hypothetical protein